MIQTIIVNNDFEVEVEGTCHIENNGIGWYEFWGFKEYDAGVNSWELDDDLTWDESKHTPEQNEAIKQQLENIEETFCINYGRTITP